MTEPTDTKDIERMSAYVEDTLPRPYVSWPGGWPEQVELALIDAVFSIRANYGHAARDGKPATGVHRVLDNWRAVNGDRGRLDDLQALASQDADVLLRILGNKSRTAGRPKATAVTEAARALVGVGLRHAEDLNPADTHQKAAYIGVTGLGPVTWSYFCMLLGEPDVKADTWVCRYVSKALDREVSSTDSRALVKAVASRLTVDPTRLDHAIWAHARTRRR